MLTNLESLECVETIDTIKKERLTHDDNISVNSAALIDAPYPTVLSSGFR